VGNARTVLLSLTVWKARRFLLLQQAPPASPSSRYDLPATCICSRYADGQLRDGALRGVLLGDRRRIARGRAWTSFSNFRYRPGTLPRQPDFRYSVGWSSLEFLVHRSRNLLSPRGLSRCRDLLNGGRAWEKTEPASAANRRRIRGPSASDSQAIRKVG